MLVIIAINWNSQNAYLDNYLAFQSNIENPLPDMHDAVGIYSYR